MLYDQQIINFDQYKVYQINYIQLSYRTPEKFELQKHLCSSFQKFIPDNIELRLKIPSVRIYLDICRISIKNFSPIQRLTKDLLPFENSPAVSYENMNQFRIFLVFLHSSTNQNLLISYIESPLLWYQLWKAYSKYPLSI